MRPRIILIYVSVMIGNPSFSQDKVIAGVTNLQSGQGTSFVAQKDSTFEVIAVNQFNHSAEIIDIAYSGGKLYQVGKYLTEKGPVLFYSCDAVVKIISESNHDYANSIEVAGSDVYITGVFKKGDNNHACYWKNGKRVLLSKLPSEANKLVIDGKDIYVAGHIRKKGISVAAYWKNGEITELGSGKTHSSLQSIVIADKKVYSCGFTTRKVNQATYWIEESGIVLSENESLAVDLKLTGYDVIILGQEVIVSNNTAVVWENNSDAKTVLFSRPNYEAKAIGLLINEEDVYITGLIENLKGNNQSILWKNYKQYFLNDSDSNTSITKPVRMAKVSPNINN